MLADLAMVDQRVRDYASTAGLDSSASVGTACQPGLLALPYQRFNPCVKLVLSVSLWPPPDNPIAELLSVHYYSSETHTACMVFV
jgi:hypothetical protein